MTTKKSKKLDFFRRNWAYFVVVLAVFATAYFGSLDKTISYDDTMNVRSIVSSGAQISADQVNQFYMVAEMADSMNLASANLAQTNYDTLSLLQQNSQTADDSGKISKPIAVNLAGVSRGVVQYQVKDGESLEAIAARYGVTTDQIRWSNGLKTTDISPGQSLLIPTVPGIAYKVKNGDNVDSIAEKLKSSASDIIAVNDLEINRDLAVDTVILVPSGVLPETERPEYVVPTTSYGYSSSASSAASSYHYAASYASGNKYAYGWCTWYAWQWRHDNMGGKYDLPSNLGNANTWANAARAAGFNVNRTPAYGAVFQTSAGWLGHVGVVTKVNADGSIVISDMNGIAGWGRVGSKTISASEAAQYTYIHGR